MSAIKFYLSKGYTPMNKNVIISGPDTLAIWTPITGKRVILTDISITANQAGTITLFLYDPGIDNRFAIFSLAASTTIAPRIECVEGTIVGGAIYARTLGNTTNGWNLNLTGFEI